MFQEKNGYFVPSESLIEKANARQYKKLIEEARDDPVKLWQEVAKELNWYTPWEKTLNDQNPPFYKWFEGGKVNIFHNAVERYNNTPMRNKLALIWEGENGEMRTYSYHALCREVNKCANLLKNMGVKKGDRVTIFLPKIPEQIMMMLACAKIGAIHHIAYIGLDAYTLRQQILSTGSKCVVASDGSFRSGVVVPLKKDVLDEALKLTPTVKTVIVVKRTGQDVPMEIARDYWFHELVNLPIVNVKEETEAMDAEDPLFIIYRPHISQRSGLLNGYLYTHGGYMVGAYFTTKLIGDLKDIDRYWCTSDPAWITGHTYTVYGPLLNGATIFFYEGIPVYPYPDKWWSLVEKYEINIFTAIVLNIKNLMRQGDAWLEKHDLSSLRLLGTMDEPIDLEIWNWYFKTVGKEQCHIMDVWGQIETGGLLISTLPTMPLKPGSIGTAFPGIVAGVVNEEGKEVGVEEEGYLVIKKPWPYMLRTIYENQELYKDRYWSKMKGVYYTGDIAKKDKNGYISVVKRITF
ncbi:MAG TPA: acetyl-coenzyme A synthetase [Desulfotomaculum sp.]|nr:acetyl-coenzyme A synthetase [Desulfotomaculum sp.]